MGRKISTELLRGARLARGRREHDQAVHGRAAQVAALVVLRAAGNGKNVDDFGRGQEDLRQSLQLDGLGVERVGRSRHRRRQGHDPQLCLHEDDLQRAERDVVQTRHLGRSGRDDERRAKRPQEDRREVHGERQILPDLQLPQQDHPGASESLHPIPVRPLEPDTNPTPTREHLRGREGDDDGLRPEGAHQLGQRRHAKGH